MFRKARVPFRATPSTTLISSRSPVAPQRFLFTTKTSSFPLPAIFDRNGSPQFQVLEHPWLLSTAPSRRPIKSLWAGLRSRFFLRRGLKRIERHLVPGYAFPQHFVQDATALVDNLAVALTGPNAGGPTPLSPALAARFARGTRALEERGRRVEITTAAAKHIRVVGLHFAYGPLPVPADHGLQKWWDFITLAVPRSDLVSTSHADEKRIMDAAMDAGVVVHVDARVEGEVRFVVKDAQGTVVLEDRRDGFDVRRPSLQITARNSFTPPRQHLFPTPLAPDALAKTTLRSLPAPAPLPQSGRLESPTTPDSKRPSPARGRAAGPLCPPCTAGLPRPSGYLLGRGRSAGLGESAEETRSMTLGGGLDTPSLVLMFSLVRGRRTHPSSSSRSHPKATCAACPPPEVSPLKRSSRTRARTPNMSIAPSSFLTGCRIPALSGSCTHCLHVSQDSGWWTYEYCHRQYVRQYHPTAKGEPHPDADYFLAIFSPDPPAHAFYGPGRIGSGEAGAEFVEHDEDGRHFLRQWWGDGTICDYTGRPRMVEVQFHCCNGEHVSSIKEVAVCVYIVIIHTNRICREQYFKPRPTVAPSSIECRPIMETVSPPALVPASPSSLKRKKPNSIIRHVESHDPSNIAPNPVPTGALVDKATVPGVGTGTRLPPSVPAAASDNARPLLTDPDAALLDDDLWGNFEFADPLAKELSGAPGLYADEPIAAARAADPEDEVRRLRDAELVTSHLKGRLADLRRDLARLLAERDELLAEQGQPPAHKEPELVAQALREAVEDAEAEPVGRREGRVGKARRELNEL
ncbi:hypothetical protein BDK51DRAFT_43524 [Blyttiomyces helicus]|uniref:Protein OS-9 homolog n=1 Tax=Blyttiomyces helicus TaxID=388810 RepID=A0A4P9WTG8_9FUNG|nr:hypothetical protein BDK51DRAFT_43524 [Blyttiomyces helicus]|eukprot:RKO94650.1 hypothetical protein BDK51DRAFT_43524 [Blyttiomyces helicus]